MKKIENDTIKYQLIEKIVSQKFNNLDEYDNVINLNNLLEDDTDIYYATYYEAKDPTDENSDGKRYFSYRF